MRHGAVSFSAFHEKASRVKYRRRNPPVAVATPFWDLDRSTTLPSALFVASLPGRCMLRSVGAGCCNLVIGLRLATRPGAVAQSPGRDVFDPFGKPQAAWASEAS